MPPSATKVVVVSDAGPLIALGRLDLLELLARLFDEVQVPEAVLRECLARPELPDAQRIQLALGNAWLRSCVAPPGRVEGLGASESAAIGRALEIGAVLLADDQAARVQARRRGLVVIGTLAVLILAKRKALLPAVAPLVEQLRATGHHLGDAAVSEALKLAGE